MALLAFHNCLGCHVDWTDGRMISPCPKCGLTHAEWLYDNVPAHKKAMDELSAKVVKTLKANSPFYKLFGKKRLEQAKN